MVWLVLVHGNIFVSAGEKIIQIWVGCIHNKDLASILPVGDAVWDAGDRPGGLAEKHNLQTLCPK